MSLICDTKTQQSSFKEDIVDVLKDFIVESLYDDKAEDIAVIDLRGKTDIARYMIVCTARSGRHAASTAVKLVDRLKEQNLPYVEAEGLPSGDWILIDCLDIVIHIFKPETRAYYNLEKMWKY